MSSSDEDDAITAIEADDPMTDDDIDDKANMTDGQPAMDDDVDYGGHDSNSVPLALLRKRARLEKAAKAAVVDAEEEEEDDDDGDDNNADKTDDEPPSFATALGLHRVGSKLPVRPQPLPPVQVLNARGMPARIRKKNKLFFDDNIVNDRPLRTSPSKRSTAAQQNAAAANTSSRSTAAASTSAAAAAAAAASQPRKVTPKKGKGVVSRYMKLKEETKKKREAAAAAAASTAIAETEKLLSGRAGRLSASASTSAATDGEADPSTSDDTNSLVERASYERTGRRLRNLLKLPKAHKWVSYEWFYSYIDLPLFEGPNDFEICLRESFPDLKTRHLSRPEWSFIRSIMGKPRRCSTAFFAEERAELERRRHKIRTLQSTRRQQQLSTDWEYTRNLPAEVPLALPVGTKVTARLRYPSDGLFMGTVAAVDPLTSTYRITFDKHGLGTHSVPDFEIMANDYAEMLPLISQYQLQMEAAAAAAVAAKQHRLNRNNTATSARQQAQNTNRNDPLLGSEIFNNSTLKALVGSDGVGQSSSMAAQAAVAEPKVGGFHYKLLELIIRTRRSLQAKASKLARQKHMNDEATITKTFSETLPDDFQRRYASIVIGMEKLNRDMQENLGQIQAFTGDLAKDPALAATMEPSYMRERCKELALETVQKNNSDVTKNDHMMRMIHDLATIMWVASNMTSAGDASSATPDRSHVNRVLEVCLSESRARLVDTSNEHAFRQHVEVHMRHLENDLRKGGAAQLGAP